MRVFTFTLSIIISLFLFLSCGTENKPIYNFTATASPEQGGTISPSFGQYEEGNTLEVKATPSDGWEFTRWEGDLTGSDNPTKFKINKEYNVTGVFQRRNFGVNITIQGEGTVLERIVSSPLKTTEYPFETIVQLTSKPTDGWVFYEWSNDLDGNENPQTIEIVEGKEVTSIFKSIDELLAIEITGQGTIDIQQVSFEENPSRRTVTLTPKTSGNWEFEEWAGDISSTEEVIEVSIDRNINLTASFEEFSSSDNETEIVEVISSTGRIWMDRNLGASRAATGSTDSHAYGDLYQWGRAADGHQRRNSSTTSTLSSSNKPNHGSFILAPSPPFDWRSPQNNNLWQGVNGTNNPCPSGYRLPTESEWNAEHQSWSSDNAAGAFNSPLKLPVAGGRHYISGSLAGFGSSGGYWSASRLLFFSSSTAYMSSGSILAFGFSVRCIKD